MFHLSPGARTTHDSHRDVWIMGRSLERSAEIINSFSPCKILAGKAHPNRAMIRVWLLTLDLLNFCGLTVGADL
jgi:hypothetical protein